MATRTTILVQDDLDGSPASATRRFGLDGVEFEIDLSDENSAALSDALEGWQRHARRVGKTALPKSSRNGLRAFPSPERDTLAIRQWATERGIPISMRGRIPVNVVEEYEARNTVTNPPIEPVEPQPPVEAPKPVAPVKKAPAKRARTPKFTA
jgi:hypothetical protein